LVERPRLFCAISPQLVEGFERKKESVERVSCSLSPHRRITK
jgi:hypothetical protein